MFLQRTSLYTSLALCNFVFFVCYILFTELSEYKCYGRHMFRNFTARSEIKPITLFSHSHVHTFCLNHSSENYSGWAEVKKKCRVRSPYSKKPLSQPYSLNWTSRNILHSDKWLKVQLCCHMVVRCVVSWEIAKLF